MEQWTAAHTCTKQGRVKKGKGTTAMQTFLKGRGKTAQNITRKRTPFGKLDAMALREALHRRQALHKVSISMDSFWPGGSPEDKYLQFLMPQSQIFSLSA